MALLLRKIPFKHYNNFTKRFKSSSTKQKEKNYIIRRATADDVKPVLKLMRRAYFPEEPTTSSLAFTPNTLFTDHVTRLLRGGYSFIAQCKYNSDILGAAINESTNCWDPSTKDKSACKGDEKTRQLLHFYAHMQRVPNLWRRYGVQQIFEICYLFVRKDERNKGIGRNLVQYSRMFAADCGYPLVRINATCFYTSKLCERAKMKLIVEIPYCTFLGYDQQPIFRPPDPHRSVKIYIDDEPHKNSLIIAREIKPDFNLIKRTKSSSNKERINYLILRAKPDDYDDIVKLMKKSYFPEEPTASSIAFTPNVVYEEITCKALSEGYSFIAKCKDKNEILGASINETSHWWDPEMKDKLSTTVNCIKTKELLRFYAHLQRTPDLWSKYNIDQIFEVAYLFVKKEARGKGVAEKLLQHSRIFAADCGFSLVRVDATSSYTAKLCEKVKMKLVEEIPYNTYLGQDQQPIFKPPIPHTSVKVYIDDEPQKNATLIAQNIKA